MKKNKGFTLLELLVVVLLIGVLMAMAAPSYKYFIENQKVRSALNEWQNSFYFAQKEAMRIKKPVYLCGSSNGKTCDNPKNFHKGWIVVTGDPKDENQAKVLQDIVFSEKNMRMDITGNAFNSKGIVFNSSGRANANGTLSICIFDRKVDIAQATCNKDTSHNGRVYVISPAGRLIGKKVKK